MLLISFCVAHGSAQSQSLRRAFTSARAGVLEDLLPGARAHLVEARVLDVAGDAADEALKDLVAQTVGGGKVAMVYDEKVGENVLKNV